MKYAVIVMKSYFLSCTYLFAASAMQSCKMVFAESVTQLKSIPGFPTPIYGHLNLLPSIMLHHHCHIDQSAKQRNH